LGTPIAASPVDAFDRLNAPGSGLLDPVFALPTTVVARIQPEPPHPARAAASSQSRRIRGSWRRTASLSTSFMPSRSLLSAVCCRRYAVGGMLSAVCCRRYAVGGMHVDGLQQPLGVHQDLPLAPDEFLGALVPAYAATRVRRHPRTPPPAYAATTGRLDRWAVDGASAGLGMPSSADAVLSGCRPQPMRSCQRTSVRMRSCQRTSVWIRSPVPSSRKRRQ